MLRFFRLFLKLLLPIVAIVIAVFIAKNLMESAPKQERKSKPAVEAMVEVLVAKAQDYTVKVHSQGVVEATTTGVLVAEVSGRIVRVFNHFYKGGSFKKDEVLLQIDPKDYQHDLTLLKIDLIQADAAIEEAQAAVLEAQAMVQEVLAGIQGAIAAVQEAEAALQEAQAKTDIARNDWKSFSKNTHPPALALHLPALASKKAILSSKKALLKSKKASLKSKKALLASRKASLGSKKAARRAIEARIQQAKRRLSRTTIRAPYAGRILKKQVEVGQYVNTGTVLTSIYGLDSVEVRLPLSDQQVAFISLPESYLNEKQTLTKPAVSLLIPNPRQDNGMPDFFRWQGEIVRTEGDIDRQSRQQFVIARINNPYKKQADHRPPLKIGQFVQAEIQGVTLSNVIVLPRHVMRAKDEVFVISPNNTIERRQLNVLWRDDQSVVLNSGLKAGEKVSITPLSFVINGSKVRVKKKSKKLKKPLSSNIITEQN